jgi:ATP-binding cassette subfamily B multidrug efflux pump
VLDDGKISGAGTHDQLMASNHIYQEVYKSQQEGATIDG